MITSQVSQQRCGSTSSHRSGAIPASIPTCRATSDRDTARAPSPIPSGGSASIHASHAPASGSTTESAGAGSR